MTQSNVMQPAYVFTGVTSGFGAVALARIRERVANPIIVGARTGARGDPPTGDEQVTVLPLDLESLDSVRRFCTALRGVPICALGLNAGINARSITLTQDGIERSFQVNFLSHFLIFQRLYGQLIDGAITVTTGSGTHDPLEKTPAPAPRHARARLLAHPHHDTQRDRFGPRAAGRAYTASKLCCILLAREIARRFPKLNSVSFDPGFVPSTRLAREFPPLLTSVVKRVVPLLMPGDRTSTLAAAAAAYADVALGHQAPADNGGYLCVRGDALLDVEPSALARDVRTGAALWTDSLELLCLPETVEDPAVRS